VWDLRTRRELDTFKPPRTDQASAVGLSPDGQTLAAAGNQGVKVWDVASGHERTSFQRLVRLSYYPGLAFSPDLRVLAAANYQDVDLWDAATGKMARVLSHTVKTASFTCAPRGDSMPWGQGPEWWSWCWVSSWARRPGFSGRAAAGG
jgi:WD40 repeat protein